MSKPVSFIIWVDADACPRIIKEIIFKASARLKLQVMLVANTCLKKHSGDFIDSVTVSEGPDAADDYIVKHAAPTDLVITADIPLAARIVSNGGIALDPRGDRYTEDNVSNRLATRDLLMELRAEGTIHGGPRPFSCTDRQRFASSFDRLLTQLIKR